MAAADLGTAEWKRSKITNQDINLLKKLGISKKPKAVCFPSEESYPTPPMGYRILENLGSDEKRLPLKPPASAQSPPPAVSPKNKRKRNDVEDCTSKPEEAVPSRQAAYDPYLETLIPMMKDLFRIGAQFIGYRDYNSKTEEKLAEVNERANTLAQKLEQSEEARKKAESDVVQARREADKAKADAAGVEDLRKRLHDAETSLSEHITAQSAREEAILKRLRTQNRCFVNKTSQEFELEDPDNDPLLDAVSFLEFHGTEAREGIDQARTGLSRLFPYFFPKKEEPATFLALAKCFNPPDLGLKMRQENLKVVESTVALVADSQQTIDGRKWATRTDRADEMAIVDQGKAQLEENPVLFRDQAIFDS
ncbi:hypothetical protein QYE76_051252 [Lolium multiflorum]|uniref:Uncharacterized protein n=1 Tax=Lolium multiflorum TaxID=4521 RepID=A0AAD8STC9_LOLMU|nr:hypothetical protein QYE76_051252 [Lolium multiflorum]